MKRLALLLGILLIVGCSPAPNKQPNPEIAEPVPAREQPIPESTETPSTGTAERSADAKPTSPNPSPTILVTLEGPKPPADGLPEPNIPIPQPPYSESTPHPLPIESLDVDRVQDAVDAAAPRWVLPGTSGPGTFHVNSYWYITEDLRITSGFLDGARVAGVVSLPAEVQAQFHTFSANVGGDGPATIVGVRAEWVLVRHGMTYGVFNYRTGETNISDENAIPGKRTVLSLGIIDPEDALATVSRFYTRKRNWWIRFDPEFTYPARDGSEVQRPVWVFQALSGSNEVLYVDAQTGRIPVGVQSEAPIPRPEDHGYIGAKQALRTTLSGMRGDISIQQAVLIEEWRHTSSTGEEKTAPVWRITLEHTNHKGDVEVFAIAFVHAVDNQILKLETPSGRHPGQA